MTQNQADVRLMDEKMTDLAAARAALAAAETGPRDEQGDIDLDKAQASVKKAIRDANAQHKVLKAAGHSDATTHFPSLFRSRRWRGTKIKGGRRTRRRRKRRHLRRKRTRKRRRRSRRKRRRFKKRTKKR